MHPGKLQWMTDQVISCRLASKVRPDLFTPYVTEGDQYFIAGPFTTTVALVRRDIGTKNHNRQVTRTQSGRGRHIVQEYR